MSGERSFAGLDRRDAMLLGLRIEALRGIEFGPLDRPLVRRGDGPILYVDHADKAALSAKYADDANIHVGNIVEVDIVWTNKDLHDAVGHRVDYVVASHVIEHVPDLIGWLNEVANVLEPDGHLRLAIPDRRYTFDYRRGESRLSDVLEAWVVQGRRPMPRMILDYYLGISAVDALQALSGQLGELHPLYTLEHAVTLAKDAVNGGYHDVHCWVFTAASFMALMTQLAEFELLPFSIEALVEPEPKSIEFFVHLRRCDPRLAAPSWRAQAHRINPHCSPDDQRRLIDTLRDRTGTLGAETGMLRAEIGRLRAEADAVRAELATIVNSRSWRATAPLRRLRGLLSRASKTR